MYTRLSTVKGVLGIQHDELDGFITRQIRVYSELFDTMCGKSFYFEEEIEERVGIQRSQQRIILEKTPIKEVFEVHDQLTGKTYEEDFYFIEDKKSGFLTTKNFWKPTTSKSANITGNPPTSPLEMVIVKYSGGYVTPSQAKTDPQKTRTLPFDLEEAIIQGVTSAVTFKGVDGSVEQISVGDGTTRLGSIEGGSRNIPEYFREMVQKYRKIGV